MEDKDYKALTNTTREENLSSVYDEFGVRYSADGKKLISTPVGLVGGYKIKPGTESICDSAFQFKVDLGVVDIPSSVKYIGRCAFVQCQRLMYANLPVEIEYMGDMAFSGCNLQNLYIPQSLKSIPDNAYAGNEELKTIILHNEIEKIGGGAFQKCKGIEMFTFPPKIKIIERNVLRHCWNLEKVILPDGVTIIRSGAFSYTGIETVQIPESVEIIEDYVFLECRNFKGVKVPQTAQISEHAFSTEYVWD